MTSVIAELHNRERIVCCICCLSCKWAGIRVGFSYRAGCLKDVLVEFDVVICPSSVVWCGDPLLLPSGQGPVVLGAPVGQLEHVFARLAE